MVKDLITKITTEPMYSTYDFTFNDYEYGKHQAIVNYGICVKGETNFYWILQEITELECLGLDSTMSSSNMVGFNHVVNIGVQYNKFRVDDVNDARWYNKFDSSIGI